MTITKEEQNKMRNCAVFLGEPAATELVRVLDALAAAEARAEQAEAVWDVLLKRIISPSARCPDIQTQADCEKMTCREHWLTYARQEAQKRGEGKVT